MLHSRPITARVYGPKSADTSRFARTNPTAFRIADGAVPILPAQNHLGIALMLYCQQHTCLCGDPFVGRDDGLVAVRDTCGDINVELELSRGKIESRESDVSLDAADGDHGHR